jgi:multimeric flavodoxin WrbA
MLLERFVAGALGAGAKVERVAARELAIEPCCARMPCWYRTPGICVHQDDMADLVVRMAAADVWVLATPVHLGGMSELMVRLMERTVMLLSPMFEIRDGLTRHVGAPQTQDKSIVLISTCGYYEISAFDSLVAQVEDLSRSHHRRFAGALLRPHGLALRFMQSNDIDVRDVLDAAQKAGEEIVRLGTLSQATRQAVSRPLLPQEEFVSMMNSAFERRMGCRPGAPGCGLEKVYHLVRREGCQITCRPRGRRSDSFSSTAGGRQWLRAVHPGNRRGLPARIPGWCCICGAGVA